MHPPPAFLPLLQPLSHVSMDKSRTGLCHRRHERHRLHHEHTPTKDPLSWTHQTASGPKELLARASTTVSIILFVTKMSSSFSASTLVGTADNEDQTSRTLAEMTPQWPLTPHTVKTQILTMHGFTSNLLVRRAVTTAPSFSSKRIAVSLTASNPVIQLLTSISLVSSTEKPTRCLGCWHRCQNHLSRRSTPPAMSDLHLWMCPSLKNIDHSEKQRFFASSLNCGALCAFSSLKMSSQHTLGVLWTSCEPPAIRQMRPGLHKMSREPNMWVVKTFSMMKTRRDHRKSTKYLGNCEKTSRERNKKTRNVGWSGAGVQECPGRRWSGASTFMNQTTTTT